MSGQIDHSDSQDGAPAPLTRRALFEHTRKEMLRRGDPINELPLFVPSGVGSDQIRKEQFLANIEKDREHISHGIRALDQTPSEIAAEEALQRELREEAEERERRMADYRKVHVFPRSQRSSEPSAVGSVHRSQSPEAGDRAASFDGRSEGSAVRTRLYERRSGGEQHGVWQGNGEWDSWVEARAGAARELQSIRSSSGPARPASDCRSHRSSEVVRAALETSGGHGSTRYPRRLASLPNSAGASNGSRWSHRRELDLLKEEMLRLARLKPEDHMLRTFDMKVFEGETHNAKIIVDKNLIINAEDGDKSASRAAAAVPESLPPYHVVDGAVELGAYLASASYIISLAGAPLPDLKYGIVIVPAGEESLLFAGHGDHAVLPADVKEEIFAKSKAVQREQAKEFNARLQEEWIKAERYGTSEEESELDDDERDFYERRFRERNGLAPQASGNRDVAPDPTGEGGPPEAPGLDGEGARILAAGKVCRIPSPYGSDDHITEKSIHQGATASAHDMPSAHDEVSGGKQLSLCENVAQTEPTSTREEAASPTPHQSHTQSRASHTSVRAPDSAYHAVPAKAKAPAAQEPPETADPPAAQACRPPVEMDDPAQTHSNNISVPDPAPAPAPGPALALVPSAPSVPASTPTTLERDTKHAEVSLAVLSPDACRMLEQLLDNGAAAVAPPPTPDKKPARGPRRLLNSLLANVKGGVGNGNGGGGNGGRRRPKTAPSTGPGPGPGLTAAARRDVLLEAAGVLACLANGELRENPGIDARVWEAARREFALKGEEAVG